MTISRYWKLTIALWVCILSSVGMFIVFEKTFGAGLFALVFTLICILVGSTFLLKFLTYTDTARIEALKNSLNNLRDNDYSVSLACSGEDDVDELIDCYNLLVEKLRSERQRLYQRELLLDTVIENVDLALFLVDQNNTVIYANSRSAQVLNAGNAIVGLDVNTLMGAFMPALGDLLHSQKNGILELDHEGQTEKYLVSSGSFSFNANVHRLTMLKPMTRELRKQEILAWKKVLRVVSHELNNSLAPISSMAHSAKLAFEKDRRDYVITALNTIGDRAQHLSDFVGDYARLAKLPSPVKQEVSWADFLSKLEGVLPFYFVGELPKEKILFDENQLQQVFLNLLKNAHESGSQVEEIQLQIEHKAGMANIELLDRGCGMDEEVLTHASLPFFTTKPTGSGIGLSLCSEIIESHDGKTSFQNREGGGLCVRIQLPLGA